VELKSKKTGSLMKINGVGGQEDPHICLIGAERQRLIDHLFFFAFKKTCICNY
jgi:hypothetical protein